MEIVPKTFGENLNEWFRLLGRTWKPLLVSSLVAFVPIALVLAALLAFTGAADRLVDIMDPEYLESLSDAELFDFLWSFFWAWIIWMSLYTIGGVFVYLAASRVVAEDRAGMTPTWQTAARHATRRLIPALLAGLIALIGLALLIGAAVAAGWALIDLLGTDFLAIFVTAVVSLTAFVLLAWLGLSVSLYPQVMVMEGSGPTRALQRSFALVRRRWWVTLGFILVASLIASAVSQVLGLVLIPLSIVAAFVPQAFAVIYLLAGLLQGPVAAAVGAANAVWYLDLRSRDQPFDTAQIV